MNPVKNLQQLALRLIEYWVERDCVWSQPYDMPMGAGTFHPHTFLRGIGPEPWRSVYVQPCRRPVDGRYGESPYRFQHYYQLQVLLKPAPADIVDVFLASLESVGISLKEHDIGLLEDDWKGPTLGAWGLGWEVRANGQEITQFTYFQQLGGMDVDVVCGEITYGLERLFMYATGAKNGLEIPYNDRFTYGDVFKQNEFEFSHFNFKQADVQELLRQFGRQEEEVARLVGCGLVLPAYDAVLVASHCFNMLDARGALSAGERQRYIGRVRDCARLCAELYRKERENLGFPMISRLPSDARLGIRGEPLARLESAPGAMQIGSHERRDLVVEIGVEELPPAFQKTVLDEAPKFIEKCQSLMAEFSAEEAFAKQFVTHSASCLPEIEVTQRRIVLIWKGLPGLSAESQTEIWGPAERIAFKDGLLTQAGLGFCRKNGIDASLVQLKEKDGTKFLYFLKSKQPQVLPEVVLTQFESWVANLPCGLKMRWLPAQISEAFVRPVRWILALYGTEVVPLRQSKFGLTAGRKTCGQRIQSPQFEDLPDSSGYFEFLKSKGIVLRYAERVQIIQEQSVQSLQSAGLVGLNVARIKYDSGLLMKCAGLSESPYVFVGQFPESHLRLPPELVSSVLRDHMNAFSVESQASEGENGDKRLLPYFVGIANYRPKDRVGMTAAAEQVVIGRLSDGSFYYDSDLETSFEVLQDKLQRQVFQDGLGYLSDKTNRMKAVAAKLAGFVPGFDELLSNQAQAAAVYSKMDLQTGCVAEFPDEMQGLMGGVLIRHRGTLDAFSVQESLSIAQAISEHYKPQNTEDQIPKSLLGQILALADKWDTVCCLMARGDRVKGNKDPFGLRRNFLAILKLTGATGDRSLIQLTPAQLMDCAKLSVKLVGLEFTSELANDIADFLVGRFSAVLREKFLAGAADAVSRLLKNSLLESCAADTSGDVQLKSALTFSQSFELAKSIDFALQAENSELHLALASYKRARNIVEKSDLDRMQSKLKVDSSFFEHEAERVLLQTVESLLHRAQVLVRDGDFDGYISALGAVQTPLATFFENVMVNVEKEEVKTNRLLLLSRVLELYESFADFSAV